MKTFFATTLFGIGAAASSSFEQSKLTGTFTNTAWYAQAKADGFNEPGPNNDFSDVAQALWQDGTKLEPRCGSTMMKIQKSGRSEMGYLSTNNKEGETRYYGFSFAVDPDVGVTKQAGHEFFYFESKGSFKQLMSFRFGHDTNGNAPYTSTLTPAGVFFQTHYPKWKEYPDQPLIKGAWNDFVLKIKWSKEEKQGSVAVWMNGKEYVPETPAQTLWGNDQAFFHFGTHSNPNGYQDAAPVFYFDCFAEADGWAKVEPPTTTTTEKSSGGSGSDSSAAPFVSSIESLAIACVSSFLAFFTYSY